MSKLTRLIDYNVCLAEVSMVFNSGLLDGSGFTMVAGFGLQLSVVTSTMHMCGIQCTCVTTCKSLDILSNFG